MDTLLIINSLLVAICLYFIKDVHTDFKDVAKRVNRLDNKVQNLNQRLRPWYRPRNRGGVN